MGGMSEFPWEWTDEDAHAYLLARWGPPERWRIYGYVGDDGQPWEVMDDDDDRYERLVAYLEKIEAPQL